MARYENYSQIPDETERKAKALADLKEWLGEERYNKTSQIVRERIAAGQPMRRSQFLLTVSFIAGAEGYPVECWADELGLISGATPEQQGEEQ